MKLPNRKGLRVIEAVRMNPPYIDRATQKPTLSFIDDKGEAFDIATTPELAKDVNGENEIGSTHQGLDYLSNTLFLIYIKDEPVYETEGSGESAKKVKTGTTELATAVDVIPHRTLPQHNFKEAAFEGIKDVTLHLSDIDCYTLASRPANYSHQKVLSIIKQLNLKGGTELSAGDKVGDYSVSKITDDGLIVIRVEKGQKAGRRIIDLHNR